MVVTYFLQNTLHATRHAAGCGILLRAQRQADAGVTSGGHGIASWNNLKVWEDAIFAGLPDYWHRTIKNHSCVKEAPVAQQPGLV